VLYVLLSLQAYKPFIAILDTTQIIAFYYSAVGWYFWRRKI